MRSIADITAFSYLCGELLTILNHFFTLLSSCKFLALPFVLAFLWGVSGLLKKIFKGGE